jgi:cell division septation protein DedD
MKKTLLCFIFTALAASCIFSAELKAKDLTSKAAQKANIEESIEYLNENAEKITSLSDKRSVYIFLASLQEQMNLYEDARLSYAKAASIAAGDAEGMPKKSNEQLVLDAVRCALSSGDYITANNYLNSSVRNSKNPVIQAYIKLYSQWSELCRAETKEDLQEPLVMLQTYLKLDSMKELKSTILLTLWYITGDKSYSSKITADYPSSMEAAIVKGDIQLLPTPFWFFVPKAGEAEQGTGTYKAATTEITPAPDESPSKEESTQAVKLQLGLFKTENNAKLLQKELTDKGFEAYITTEKRASGTTYYIVLVNENANNTNADKLRSAGYECYVVE